MAQLRLVRPMTSLFNLEPIPAPHKTKRFWTLVGLVIVAVLCGTLTQRAVGLSLHAPTTSGIITLAVGISGFLVWRALWRYWLVHSRGSHDGLYRLGNILHVAHATLGA